MINLWTYLPDIPKRGHIILRLYTIICCTRVIWQSNNYIDFLPFTTLGSFLIESYF